MTENTSRCYYTCQYNRQTHGVMDWPARWPSSCAIAILFSVVVAQTHFKD
jgi:hypothetical protein